MQRFLTSDDMVDILTTVYHRIVIDQTDARMLIEAIDDLATRVADGWYGDLPAAEVVKRTLDLRSDLRGAYERTVATLNGPPA